ncbi:MAG: chorismate mutase [Clostridia bacterium]|nr:chorismate mutase [Clostridia bacterium]
MEKTLEELRLEIDKIDTIMAECFENRMHIVADIAKIKAATGKNTYDPEREKYVIEKNCALMLDKELIPFYKDFLQHNMDLSKAYQNMLREQKKFVNDEAIKMQNKKA